MLKNLKRTHHISAKLERYPVTGSTHCANDSSVERKKALEKVDDNQKKDCKSDIVGNEILREPKFEIIYRNGLDLGRFWLVVNFLIISVIRS